MDNLGLWLMIAAFSGTIALISVGLSILSKWRTVVGFVPQMLVFMLSIFMAITASVSGGWEALGFMIISAMALISSVISAALFGVVVIVRNSKNKTKA
jgi:hypothetical protein